MPHTLDLGDACTPLATIRDLAPDATVHVKRPVLAKRGERLSVVYADAETLTVVRGDSAPFVVGRDEVRTL